MSPSCRSLHRRRGIWVVVGCGVWGAWLPCGSVIPSPSFWNVRRAPARHGQTRVATDLLPPPASACTALGAAGLFASPTPTLDVGLVCMS